MGRNPGISKVVKKSIPEKKFFLSIFKSGRRIRLSEYKDFTKTRISNDFSLVILLRNSLKVNKTFDNCFSEV